MARDPKITSKIMASVRSKDTQPELAVRRRVWGLGYRYRKHHKGVEGHPDLVFVGARVAVFIDGDFWHGHAWRLRGMRSLKEMFPTRTEWWVNKIRRNVERDREVERKLRSQGWTVLRFWESDVQKDPDRVVRKIAKVVGHHRGR